VGTWGTGNFDGDGPSDYLDGVIDSLEEDIEECFAGEGINVGSGEDVLIPALQIWSELHEGCGGHLPEPATIRKWRDAYLPVFDKEMPELADEAFTKERRQKIESTFERIERLAEAYEATVKQTFGSTKE
jgi:hypothetical protein